MGIFTTQSAQILFSAGIMNSLSCLDFCGKEVNNLIICWLSVFGVSRSAQRWLKPIDFTVRGRVKVHANCAKRVDTQSIWKMKLAMEMEIKVRWRGREEKLQRQKLLESIFANWAQGGKQARIKWGQCSASKQWASSAREGELCNDNCGEFVHFPYISILINQ